MEKTLRKLFERKGKVKPGRTQNPAKAAENNAQPLVPHIKSQVSQSVGKLRDHNEDAVFALSSEFYIAGERQVLGIFIVADGMGGHVNGELASSMAIHSTAGHLMQALLRPMSLGELPVNTVDIEQILEEAMQNAQDLVLSQVSGSGTTLTVAVVCNGMLTYGHVGDSRLYILDEQGHLQALTRDHSLVRRLVDLGQISEVEALSHPQRNVLFRALGQMEGFRVDLGHQALPAPATLLLCSDGLWGLVEEAAIAEVLNDAHKDIFTAQRLVDLANEAGGSDNISAVVVTLEA